MPLTETLTHIRTTLDHAAADLDRWFDRPAALRAYRPADGGWTADEILEHVGLTSHFLLILIDKGARKALELAPKHELPSAIEPYSIDSAALEEIGRRGTFRWVRPEHMEPSGRADLEVVRNQLREQFDRCRRHLEAMPNGEGALYKTTMTVNALGKLDVYEYIYFVAKHAERHLAQLDANEYEYAVRRTNPTE
jgi:hypothetical protein